MTPEGLAAIENTLAKLEAAYAAAVAADNKSAIESSAREIRYWAARKRTATVKSPPETADVVQFGSTVTVRRDDGRVQNFRIVGEDEAEPSTGTISYVSPFAQAVLGKRVGDAVEIADQEGEILAVDGLPGRR